ncbi:Kunitz/Bovine pancreatic trypsin inhibitor domain protein [Cooperia oncophora]
MFLHLTLTALFFGVSVAVISLDEPHVPENTYETCLTTMDRGDACCPEPNNTIRYYFDPEFQQCFSYLYEGCGGGRNTFYTEYDCRRTCIMGICIPSYPISAVDNTEVLGSSLVPEFVSTLRHGNDDYLPDYRIG